MFAEWCDDFVPAFFVPSVCSDDLTTPCQNDDHCPVGAPCVDKPGFVFPSELGLEALLVIIDLGDNWFQWMGLSLTAGMALTAALTA